jgi:tetratricopeptide (TPR) repeat protein
LIKSFNSFNKLESQRNQIISKINTWRSITDKYQGYKDGYLQLAVLEYQLQDFGNAKLYLNKALELDPNYKEAIEMKKVLKNY